jgi:hypothetical protein
MATLASATSTPAYATANKKLTNCCRPGLRPLKNISNRPAYDRL